MPASNVNKTPTGSKISALTPSSSKTPKEASNVQNVRKSLAEHRMHFNHREIYDSSTALNSEIDGILGSDRHSTVSDGDIEFVSKYMAENAVVNEATLYPELIARVLPHTHTIPGKKRAFDDYTVKWVTESYDDLHLGRVKDPILVRYLLPAEMEKEDKHLGLTNPKPDYVYGKKEPQFPDEGPDEDLKALVSVCPGLRFPFLLMENVSAEKPIAKAENQAIRGGATLVNARRRLLREAKPEGWKETPGADQESFAFSCAWSPDRIMLFVHWCQARQSQEPIFHMTRLRKYDITEADSLIKFRHDIHNIWDWGLETDIPAAERALGEIMEARAKRIAQGRVSLGTADGGACIDGGNRGGNRGAESPNT